MLKPQYQHTAGDSRMLYGMGGPFLLATGLIIAVLLIGEMWLIPFMMLAVFALTALVVWGFSHMLDETGDEEDRS